MTASNIAFSAIKALVSSEPTTRPQFARGMARILSTIICEAIFKPFASEGLMLNRYSGASTSVLVISATSTLSVDFNQSD